MRSKEPNAEQIATHLDAPYVESIDLLHLPTASLSPEKTMRVSFTPLVWRDR